MAAIQCDIVRRLSRRSSISIEFAGGSIKRSSNVLLNAPEYEVGAFMRWVTMVLPSGSIHVVCIANVQQVRT